MPSSQVNLWTQTIASLLVFQLFNTFLDYGFVKSYEDYSLFSYTRDGVELRVLVYVDDLLICCNNSSTLRKFKDYLSVVSP